MKTIYLMMGLVTLTQLSGCVRPIVESNYQKTQPLLTQMLCPTCDVPSLNPVVAKAPTSPQPVESKAISTVDNPEPISETTDIQSAPVDTAPQPVNLPPSAPSKPRVITLDLNAPDLGISSQSAPTPAPAPVPPQSRLDDDEEDDEETPTVAQLPNSKQEHIQLSEADIHNAQDVHELTVRLMNMNK